MTQSPAEQTAKPAAPGPVGLALRLLALLVATFATVLAIVLFIPDKNDYADVSALKHERLATLEGRKIVLLGGSNLAYGIETDILERETGCPTANMGMNGYFGARFILNEVKPQLNPGDIVVLAFEWDNFGKDVEGSGRNLLAVSKANPDVWQYLTLHQKGMVIESLPFVAQAKVVRIAETVLISLGLIDVSNDGPIFDMDTVENFKSFDHQGDLNGHDGVEYTQEVLEHGYDLKVLGLEVPLIELIKDFGQEMEARDVSVIMSYTPTARAYYEAQYETIDLAHQMFTSGDDAMNTPRPPQGFVFEKEFFFDNLYHLKTTTRGIRTQMLADDIKTALGETTVCNSNNQ